MGTQEDFEVIAEEAIAEAARVKCSFEEYLKGLRTIVVLISEDLELRESEKP